MNARSSWIRGPMLVGIVVGLVAIGERRTEGAHGGRSGGHGGRAPRVSAPRQTFNAPRMPRSSAPAHMNAARGASRSNSLQARTNSAQARVNRCALPHEQVSRLSEQLDHRRDERASGPGSSRQCHRVVRRGDCGGDRQPGQGQSGHSRGDERAE